MNPCAARDSTAMPDLPPAAPAIVPVCGAAIGLGFSRTPGGLQCGTRKRGERTEKARRAVSLA